MTIKEMLERLKLGHGIALFDANWNTIWFVRRHWDNHKANMYEVNSEDWRALDKAVASFEVVFDTTERLKTGQECSVCGKTAVEYGSNASKLQVAPICHLDNPGLVLGLLCQECQQAVASLVAERECRSKPLEEAPK